MAGPTTTTETREADDVTTRHVRRVSWDAVLAVTAVCLLFLLAGAVEAL